MFRRYGEILAAQENQLESEVHTWSTIPEHEVSPLIQDPTSHRSGGSDSPRIDDSTPPIDRGKNSLMGQTNEGPRLQIS